MDGLPFASEMPWSPVLTFPEVGDASDVRYGQGQRHERRTERLRGHKPRVPGATQG